MNTVGILLTSPEEFLRTDYIEPFKEALDGLGANVAYAVHAPGEHLTDPVKMREHAEILINKKPDVIWLISTATAEAAIDARNAVNATIPMVASAISSTIASTARSARNFSAIVNKGWELGADRFRILRQIMPNLNVVGVLVNPDNSSSRNELKTIEQAAKGKATIIAAEMRSANGVQTAIRQLKQGEVEAVMTTHLPLFQNNRKKILELANGLNMPVVGHRSFFVRDGALMAYSSVLSKQIEQSAQMVDTILKMGSAGAADSRIEEPKEFELVVNCKMLDRLRLTLRNAEFV